MARQPRWLGALGGFLVLAAIFAALGQWQAERAVEQATIESPDTETPVPLADVYPTPVGKVTVATTFSAGMIPVLLMLSV